MFTLIPKAEVCYQIPTTLSKFPNERKRKSGGERLPFGGGAGEEQQERWSICNETSMLLWIPCRCLGWQCPCPFVIYYSRAFSQKDACSHIQGMFIFPATNHACLRTRVAVWKNILIPCFSFSSHLSSSPSELSATHLVAKALVTTSPEAGNSKEPFGNSLLVWSCLSKLAGE